VSNPPNKHEFDEFNNDLAERAKERHDQLDDTADDFERKLRVINYETRMDIIDVSRQTFIEAFAKDSIQFQEIMGSGNLESSNFDYYLAYSELPTSKMKMVGYMLVSDYDKIGPKGDILQIDMDMPRDLSLNDQTNLAELNKYIDAIKTIYFRLIPNNNSGQPEEMYVVADKGIKIYNPTSHDRDELDKEYVLFKDHAKHLQLEYLQADKAIKLWERFGWMKLYPQKRAEISTA